MAALTSLLAEDLLWYLFGRHQLAGVNRGRDAVFAIVAKIAELSGGTFKIDVHDVVANDQHTVAITTATGTREGRSLNSMGTDVYHMKDGKVTEWWSFGEDDRASDEFWS